MKLQNISLFTCTLNLYSSYKGFSFSASSAVSEAHEMASKYERVYFDKKVICTKGVIEYLNYNTPDMEHDVTDGFALAVESSR